MTDLPDKLSAEKKAVEALKKAFEIVSATPEGQLVFKYLMSKSFFHETTLEVNKQTGEVNTLASFHNEARRRFYLRDIRPLIPVSILRKIEN